MVTATAGAGVCARGKCVAVWDVELNPETGDGDPRRAWVKEHLPAPPYTPRIEFYDAADCEACGRRHPPHAVAFDWDHEAEAVNDTLPYLPPRTIILDALPDAAVLRHGSVRFVTDDPGGP